MPYLHHSILLIAALLLQTMAADAQRPGSSITWPLSRSGQPSAPLLATYGPRVDADQPDVYFFHRGLDIPAKIGTPVYAIADGEVRLAGEYEYYDTPVVQIRHYKPGAKTCRNGGCYYSNYMHLSSVAVSESTSVEQGQLVGYTGVGSDGVANLHFEVRNGGIYQQNCAHPLMLLPYENRFAPVARIESLISEEEERGRLTLTVLTAANEWDLARVEMSVLAGARKKVERVYDLVSINYQNSPKEDPNRQLHSQDLNSVIAEPKPVRSGENYELRLVFHDLPSIVQDRTYLVRVKATDVRGKSSSVARRVQAARLEPQQPDVLAANAN